ncbi:hypothetical protein E4U19_000342 [Claviceps sp. Clav32 group G5]|nr:hypothetical protein E4U19_000342 [Claviceps sp. Clav32 group G5]
MAAYFKNDGTFARGLLRQNSPGPGTVPVHAELGATCRRERKRSLDKDVKGPGLPFRLGVDEKVKLYSLKAGRYTVKSMATIGFVMILTTRAVDVLVYVVDSCSY